MSLGRRAPAVWRAFIAASLVLWPSLAAGEDRQLPEVTSEGRSEPAEAEPRDPTAFATTVPTRGGERSRVADLVQSAPGAVVRDLGLNQPATVSLRGSTSDQVLVLLDDVPLNPACGGGVDLSTVPLSFVDRVLILRGAVGARYGEAAVGGAISLTTRRPSTDSHDYFGELSYGSFGTAEGSLGYAGPLRPDLSLLVTAFGSGSKGNFAYPYASRPIVAPDEVEWLERENNTSRRGGALARLSYSGSAIDASLLVMVDGGDRGIPGQVSFPTPTTREADVRGLASGGVAWSSGGLRLEGRVGGRLSRLQWGTWDEHGSPQDESMLSAEASASWLWGHHSFGVGLSGAREALESEYHGAHARGRIGAFASDEMTWSFLSVIPAFRYDRVGSSNGLSPKLGVSVPVTDSLTLKANAGRSFRAPSFGELFLEQGVLQPNPDLRPETSTFVDAGPEVRWRGIVASAAGFWGRYDDLILYELYAPMRARPYNFGRAEVWGGELEAEARPWLLDLHASYAMSFSADRTDDARFLNRELPYHPRHRLHARAGIAWWRLESHLEADVQSAQYLNRTSTDSLPGHARFDLGASVILDREVGLSVHAELKNLTNARDQDLYGYPLSGRSVYLAVRIDSKDRSAP
jgi:outer membrane cobalamin receptor